MTDNPKKIGIRQVVDIALIIILLIFIAQNLESINVKFLFLAFELPLIIIIASVFIIGFLTHRYFPGKFRKD